MLVIDDNNNNVKLLRMKEKLLEVSNENREENLRDYRRLVMEIDEDTYNSFVEKVKDTKYHNLPYDEQLELLLNLEQEYNDINEFQYSLRNTYQRYTNNVLKLSNLNNIYIDKIRDRISNIQGFLVNNKRLQANKKELEECNLKLIDYDKQRRAIEDRFKSMEQSLRYDFVNAEGRKIVDGISSYTNTVLEYSDNSFDLRELLDNSDKLGKLLDDAADLERAADEKLQAAKICYDNMRSIENKEIYETIGKDVLTTRYHFVLLKIAELMSTDKDNYDEIIEKRNQFKALNDLRIDCLNRLKTQFLVDPFSRTKVNSQLEFLSTYTTLTENITVMRRKIANLTTVVENRVETNNDFTIMLNQNEEFVKDDTSFEEVKNDITGEDDKLDNAKWVDVINKHDVDISDNMVVRVAEVVDGFNFNRVKEKTSSVINRVNQLFMNSLPAEETKAPELVIEESIDDNNIVKEEFLNETEVFPEEVNVSNDVVDTKFENEVEIFPEENNNDVEEANDNTKVEITSVVTHDVNDVFPGEMEETNKVDSDVVEEKVTENNIFEDIEPFEKSPLFSNKFDDSLFTELDDTDDRQDNDVFVYNKVNDDAIFSDNLEPVSEDVMPEIATIDENKDIKNVDSSMPDAFWDTISNPKKELTDEEEEAQKLTFDEQIDRLMNMDNMDSENNDLGRKR